MVDIIETTLDVSFDEPFGPLPDLLDFDKGRMASPFRSESVAVFRELWFVITDGVSMLQTMRVYRTLQTNSTHF